MQEEVRLRRSILTVPGNREKMVSKARQCGADQILLDLEDSVPVQEKEAAREAVGEHLAALRGAAEIISYRINPMDSPFAYRDLIQVMERAGQYADTVVVPKVREGAQVRAVDILLSQIESATGQQGRTGIEAIVEEPAGMLRVEEIATASERIETLVFGVADYGAAMRMPSRGASGHGEDDPDYPGDKWHYPLSRLLMAARAVGAQGIDAPYGDHRDIQGLEISCRRSASLGYDGKWAVHPDQVPVINRIYSPDQEDYERCRRVLDAYEQARQQGQGTVSLDGAMVDAASVRLAREVCAKWERIREKSG